MRKSSMGNLFSSIHSKLIKCFEVRNKGEYIQLVFDWHEAFTHDIFEIFHAKEFYHLAEDNDDGYYVNKNQYSNDKLNQMLDEAFAQCMDAGFRKLDKHADIKHGTVFVVNKNERFNFQKGKYYFGNYFTSFYQIEEAAGILHDNLSQKRTVRKEDLSKVIDDIILDIQISEEDKNTYEFIKEKFSVYGQILFAAVYSINGNPMKLPENRIASNVYLVKRSVIECKEKYSIENRCRDACIVRIVAFAATSFLAGNQISKDVDVYDPQDFEHFMDMLKRGVHIDLVLAAPDCKNMEDLIRYQLRPKRSSNAVNKKYPFRLNYIRLKWIMDSIPTTGIENSHLNVYIAPFNMTCSYFQTRYEDISKDEIKVDMYIPMFSSYEGDNGNINIPNGTPDDSYRPSFLVGRGHELYSMFDSNIKDMISECQRRKTQLISDSKYVGEGQRLIEKYASEDFDLPFSEEDVHNWLMKI